MKILNSKKGIPKLPVITLSVVLLAGLFLAPLPPFLQTVGAQAQNNNNSVGISQVINQISTQVAKADPDTNAAHLQRLLTSLSIQTAQTSGESKAIEDIRQISLQVRTYPHGVVSQSLSQLAQQIANNTSNVSPIIEQISQHKSSGKDVSQAIANVAVQLSNRGLSNINQQISQTAQLIAKQTGVHPATVESIIRQLSIQTAKIGGPDVASQSVKQIMTELNQNSNGPLTQAIIQLAKLNSNDAGKTGELLKIIKDIVKDSGGGREKGSSGGGDGGSKTISTKIIERTKIIEKPKPTSTPPKPGPNPSGPPVPGKPTTPINSPPPPGTIPITTVPPGATPLPPGTQVIPVGNDLEVRVPGQQPVIIPGIDITIPNFLGSDAGPGLPKLPGFSVKQPPKVGQLPNGQKVILFQSGSTPASPPSTAVTNPLIVSPSGQSVPGLSAPPQAGVPQLAVNLGQSPPPTADATTTTTTPTDTAAATTTTPTADATTTTTTPTDTAAATTTTPTD